MNIDDFVKQRKRTYYLEDAAAVLNTDVEHLINQIRNLKYEIEQIRREMGE